MTSLPPHVPPPQRCVLGQSSSVVQGAPTGKCGE
jgi:hypothetical protein